MKPDRSHPWKEQVGLQHSRPSMSIRDEVRFNSTAAVKYHETGHRAKGSKKSILGNYKVPYNDADSTSISKQCSQLCITPRSTDSKEVKSSNHAHNSLALSLAFCLQPVISCPAVTHFTMLWKFILLNLISGIHLSPLIHLEESLRGLGTRGERHCNEVNSEFYKVSPPSRSAKSYALYTLS
jgi:hypothetical protein